LIDDHKHAVATDEAADLVPPVQDRAVSRAGDLWILGDHKLLCADAREPSAYDVLLERKARLCFTDPPYNVKIDGHVCGLGSVRHGEFAMASGEMTPGEFVGFLQSIFRNMAAASDDGAIHLMPTLDGVRPSFPGNPRASTRSRILTCEVESVTAYLQAAACGSFCGQGEDETRRPAFHPRSLSRLS
jgi:hypothetical protein